MVAVWHGTFNMFGGATTATKDTIAAVVSTAVMIQAFVLVALELRARHNGSPTLLDRRPTASHPAGSPERVLVRTLEVPALHGRSAKPFDPRNPTKAS